MVELGVLFFVEAPGTCPDAIGRKNRQYYLICPSPLAQALEIEKGEVVEWVVEDKHTLILKRTAGRRRATSKRSPEPYGSGRRRPDA